MPDQSLEGVIDSNTGDRRRKVHRKVKTGCKACKVRRQKCDEQRPKCNSCVRYSTECVYAILAQREAQKKSRQTSLLQATRNPQPTRVRDGRLRSPTPRSDPRTSPSPELNFEDLELLHQYITSTCIATSQLPERTMQIQTIIPRMAQQYQFLMHGILGNAAVHLSWLQPARKAHYTLLAAKHHSKALPEFRSVLQHINQNNYSALILYSKGLVWCSFARFETFAGQVKTSSNQTETSWLPKWFNLLRGSCLIAERSAPWIKNDLHVLPSLDDTTEFANSLDNHQLIALESQLMPLTSSPICEPVILLLKEAFARASMRHQNTPLRNAINFWVGKIPNEFVDALHRAEAWALVIMAYICVLVSRSETRWFMKGHAVAFLQLISDRLPETWQQYIQWPREEVGF